MSELLLVACARPSLPLVILRPTVIGSTWRDPIPGFIDQVAGVPSMFLAVGMGVVIAMVGDEKNVVDMVPLDLLVNTTLASIACLLTEKEASSWPLIVHSGTSDPRENPVDYARPNRQRSNTTRVHPLVRGVFKPTLRAYKSPSRFVWRGFVSTNSVSEHFPRLRRSVQVASSRKGPRICRSSHVVPRRLSTRFDRSRLTNGSFKPMS
jgi:hypothetical protein